MTVMNNTLIPRTGGMDNDRLLLFLLIALLWQNDAPWELILALVYIAW